VVANLDLVVTVDTSVAHVAGALGTPCWLMLPHAPDWRWMLGRDTTPWYGSLRLFRQVCAGDWSGVIARIGSALAVASSQRGGWNVTRGSNRSTVQAIPTRCGVLNSRLMMKDGSSRVSGGMS